MHIITQTEGEIEKLNFNIINKHESLKKTFLINDNMLLLFASFLLKDLWIKP